MVPKQLKVMLLALHTEVAHLMMGLYLVQLKYTIVTSDSYSQKISNIKIFN
jgi:N-dimethylarginine dimethylaminohydrolase